MASGLDEADRTPGRSTGAPLASKSIDQSKEGDCLFLTRLSERDACNGVIAE